MSYPRFFVEADTVEGSVIVLDGESAQHISRSLRMKAGEKIVVCDFGAGDADRLWETGSNDTG